MGDAPLPRPSMTTKGLKSNPKIQLNRTAMFRQSISIKRGQAVQRNLLPSKVAMGPTEATKAPAPATSSSAGGAPPAPPSLNRTRQSHGASFFGGGGSKPRMTQQQLLDYEYGQYLQNFLEVALMKEMEEVERLRQVDQIAKKCVGVAEVSSDMNDIFAGRVITSLHANIALLETIQSTFESLTDFAKGDSLGKIQEILIAKHERLILEGATVKEPLFQDAELDRILNYLKKDQPFKVKGEGDIVGDFVRDYVEKLKSLTTSSEDLENKMKQLKEASEILLVKSSLLASEDGMKNEEEGESKEPMGVCEMAEAWMSQLSTGETNKPAETSGRKGIIRHSTAIATPGKCGTSRKSIRIRDGSLDEAESRSPVTPVTPMDPLQLSFLV